MTHISCASVVAGLFHRHLVWRRRQSQCRRREIQMSECWVKAVKICLQICLITYVGQHRHCRWKPSRRHPHCPTRTWTKQESAGRSPSFSVAGPPSLWPASSTREVGSRDLLLFGRASWRLWLLDTYRDTTQYFQTAVACKLLAKRCAVAAKKRSTARSRSAKNKCSPRTPITIPDDVLNPALSGN